jgi:beta-glucosidase
MFLATFLLCASAALLAQQSYPFRDPSLAREKRVDDLLNRLTLEEKISQLQDNSMAISRLGIPAYTWGNEGLHGDAFTGYTTLFPQVIGMAATWDTGLVHSMADVISTEARARYNAAVAADTSGRFLGISFWAPNINIFRDPRWGRGQETYGEDPFLTGRMAVAYITGLQGDDPKYIKSLATPKHFAVHSGPEADRHKWNSYVSAHDLADTYLSAFKAAFTEGHAGAVMCAYNRINGVPACASPWLLSSTLRNSWNFDGYVMSDCGAVADIADGHHFRPNYEQASAAALHAGMDIACDWVPDGVRSEYSYLLEAVHDHLASEAEVDRALRRVLNQRFRLGMFDPPAMVPYSSIADADLNSPAHAALAERAARESIVLLKNESGTLPLKSPGKIAVIGPDADLLQAIEGNYNAISLNPVTPLIGMKKRFGDSSILYAQGSLLAASMPIVMEYTALHPSASSKEFGLNGDYYSNTTFSGKPTLTRLDRKINFDWDKASPAPGLPDENYSIRWTGTFTPPGPGVYSIGAKGKGCTDCSNREAFQLFVDGKLILENGKKHSVQMHFSDKSPHTIRLDYVHRLVPTHHLVAAGMDLLWAPPAEVLRDEALRAVSQADTTVVCVGLSPELEGEELPVKLPGFVGGDRTDINLPASQENLLKAIAATGKPFIVVFMTGSAIASNQARYRARAVLEAWYPGQSGGDAIAATLAGENNPSGRLPVTFYANTGQLPDFHNYSMERRTYRYFNDKPIYGFGFGLSYSTFRYTGLELSNGLLSKGKEIETTLRVKNTSSRAGDEVVELYLTPPDSPTTPVRKLIGFTRIHLDAGEEKPVSFHIPSGIAMTVAEDGTPALLSGRYKVFAGDGQPGEASAFQQATFEVP